MTIVVRVTLENGNNWVTPINADFPESVTYYFHAGGFEQRDGSVSPVVRVEQLDPNGAVVAVMTADEFFRKTI